MLVYVHTYHVSICMYTSCVYVDSEEQAEVYTLVCAYIDIDIYISCIHIYTSISIYAHTLVCAYMHIR